MAGYMDYERAYRTDGVARRRHGGFGTYFQQTASFSSKSPVTSTPPVDLYTHNPLHMLQKNKATRQEAANPNNQLVLNTDRGLKVPRLHWYAYTGDLEKVQQCLLEGDDVSMTVTLTNSVRKDVFGVTPLILAAQRGHFEICQLLFEHGADLSSSVRAHGYSDWCDATIIALANNHYRLFWYLLRQQARKNWSKILRKNRNAHGMMQAYISGNDGQLASARDVRVPLMDQQPRELAPIHDDVYRPPALSAVLPEERFREQYRSRTMGRTSSARMLASVAAAAAVAASNAAARLSIPAIMPPAARGLEDVDLPLVEDNPAVESSDTWSIGCSLREFYSGELKSPLRRHATGSGRRMLPNDMEAAASAPEHSSLLLMAPSEDPGHFHEVTRRSNSALTHAGFGGVLQRAGGVAMALPAAAIALPAAAARQTSHILNWSGVYGTYSTPTESDASELDAPLMVSEEDMQSAVMLDLPSAPKGVAYGVSPSPSMQTVIEVGSEDEIDSGRLLLA